MRYLKTRLKKYYYPDHQMLDNLMEIITINHHETSSKPNNKKKSTPSSKIQKVNEITITKQMQMTPSVNVQRIPS